MTNLILVALFFGVAGVLIYIQYRLCNGENGKKLGLILPIISFIFSVLCVVSMLAFSCIVICVITVSTCMPVIGVIPLPRSRWSYAMTSILFYMHFIKMLLPIHAFHTHPVRTVAARVSSNISTANETEFTVIADSLALRAIFLTIRTYFCLYFVRTSSS